MTTGARMGQVMMGGVQQPQQYVLVPASQVMMPAGGFAMTAPVPQVPQPGQELVTAQRQGLRAPGGTPGAAPVMMAPMGPPPGAAMVQMMPVQMFGGQPAMMSQMGGHAVTQQQQPPQYAQRSTYASFPSHDQQDQRGQRSQARGGGGWSEMRGEGRARGGASHHTRKRRSGGVGPGGGWTPY